MFNPKIGNRHWKYYLLDSCLNFETASLGFSIWLVFGLLLLHFSFLKLSLNENSTFIGREHARGERRKRKNWTRKGRRYGVYSFSRKNFLWFKF